MPENDQIPQNSPAPQAGSASDNDLASQGQAYLHAFQAKDLSQCMNYFTEDSTVNFVQSVYRGRHEIEEWHKARFAAELRLARLEKISVDGNTVTLEGVATSKRLKAWRI